jgi:hypothetical protein
VGSVLGEDTRNNASSASRCPLVLDGVDGLGGVEVLYVSAAWGVRTALRGSGSSASVLTFAIIEGRSDIESRPEGSWMALRLEEQGGHARVRAMNGESGHS